MFARPMVDAWVVFCPSALICRRVMWVDLVGVRACNSFLGGDYPRKRNNPTPLIPPPPPGPGFRVPECSFPSWAPMGVFLSTNDVVLPVCPCACVRACICLLIGPLA